MLLLRAEIRWLEPILLQRGSCQDFSNENVATPQRHLKMDLEAKVYLHLISQKSGQIILLTFLEILGILCNCKQGTDASSFGLLCLTRVGQRAVSDLAQRSEQMDQGRLVGSGFCLPNTPPATHALVSPLLRCSHCCRG